MGIHVVVKDGETREIRRDREFGKPAETYFIKSGGTYINVKISGEGETVAEKRIDNLGDGLVRDLMFGASPEYVARKYGHTDNITFEIWDKVGSQFPSGAPIYQNRVNGKVRYTESDKADTKQSRGLRERLESQEMVEAVA